MLLVGARLHFRKRRRETVAERIVGHAGAACCENARTFGKHAFEIAMQERREQLAPGKIAGRPEKHQIEGWNRAASGVEGLIGSGVHRRSYASISITMPS